MTAYQFFAGSGTTWKLCGFPTGVTLSPSSLPSVAVYRPKATIGAPPPRPPKPPPPGPPAGGGAAALAPAPVEIGAHASGPPAPVRRHRRHPRRHGHRRCPGCVTRRFHVTRCTPSRLRNVHAAEVLAALIGDRQHEVARHRRPHVIRERRAARRIRRRVVAPRRLDVGQLVEAVHASQREELGLAATAPPASPRAARCSRRARRSRGRTCRARDRSRASAPPGRAPATVGNPPLSCTQC